MPLLIDTIPDVVAAGWLGPQSTIEPSPRRKFGRAMGASLTLHGIVVVLAMALVRDGRAPIRTQDDAVVGKLSLVYFPQPRAAAPGGGGGSTAPAPRKPLEIPRHGSPDSARSAPPAREPEPVPLPALNALVQTDLATVIQASGSSAVSLAAYGGGGKGGGLGSGTGAGVGPGSGGGFGGGAYRPGAGIANPVLLRQVSPKYTSEAMLAKIQGSVQLEAVVLPNGSVGDIRVVKSLDRAFGLDDEAIKADRDWLFAPARDAAGQPVPVLVTLILDFRIH